MPDRRETGRGGQEVPPKVGDTIPGKNVDHRLTIGWILDKDPRDSTRPIGHLLVDKERGNLHVYWYHLENQGGTYVKTLTHHGGPSGFSDIQKGIDQHHRVIDRYMGVETELEQSPEDKDEGLLTPPFNLRTYAQALRIGVDRIEIPGENRWVGECLYLVDRAIRGATIKMPAAQLQSRLDSLSQLQSKFSRSTNQFMQQTSLDLVSAVGAAQSEDQNKTMASLLGMKQNLNKRAQEMNEILSATIRRVSILENVRNRSEEVVTQVHFDVVRAKEKWDKAKDDQEREQIILRVTNLLGVRRLSELRVQPFRSRAQREPLQRLGNLGEYWAEGNMEIVGRTLTDGSINLISWRAQIRKRIEGELQMRFPLSKS